MPRIKGWIKTGNLHYRKEYTNRNKKSFVVVILGEPKRVQYLDKPHHVAFERQFKARKEAIKFAINWMREHPNG